ncbi:MAG: Ig-like domain-containing protein [Armatimonadota bacterium]
MMRSMLALLRCAVLLSLLAVLPALAGQPQTLLDAAPGIYLANLPAQYRAPGPLFVAPRSGQTLPARYLLSDDPVWPRLTPTQFYNTGAGRSADSWAFGIMGALESGWLNSTAVMKDFSEQNLICTHAFSLAPHQYSSTNTPPIYFPLMSTAYLTRQMVGGGWAGPVDELNDPYDPASEFDYYGGPVEAHLQDALYLPTGDRNTIKRAIMDYGAVFANAFFHYAYYSSDNTVIIGGNPEEEPVTYGDEGTYYGPNRTYTNAATAIVGWDDYFPKEKFNKKYRPGSNGAFLVKNTFGYETASVSEALIWVSYSDPMLGKLASTPASMNTKSSLAVFSDVQPVANYQKTYSYDKFGWVSSLGYSATNSVTYYRGNFATVYTAGASTEQLAAVGFYTHTLNTASDQQYNIGGYDIEVYLDVDTTGKTPYAFDTSVTPRVKLPPVHTQRVRPLRPTNYYRTDIPGYHTFPLVEVTEVDGQLVPVLDLEGNPIPKYITLNPGQRFSVVVKPVSSSSKPPIPVHYYKEGYTGSVPMSYGAMRSFVSPDGVANVTVNDTIQTTWYDLSRAWQWGWRITSLIRGVDQYRYTADVCLKAYTRSGDENLQSYTVSSSAVLNGDLVPNGAVSPEGDTEVLAGQGLTFTATPDTDYMVDTWTDSWTDYAGPHVTTTTGGTTLTLSNIRADHTVDVTFKLKPYTITPVSGGHGTIATSAPFPTTGAFTWTLGMDDPVFTATPEANYVVDYWSVNGTGVQNGGTTFTLTDIHSDKTVRVTFTLPSFMVTPSAGNNGAIFPSTPVSVLAGQSKTFTATPNAGYAVDTWTLDGDPVLPDDPAQPTIYTVRNVQAAHAVHVTFVRPPQTAPDTYSTSEDTVLTVPAVDGLLDNDTTDNPPLTVVTTPVFPPSHGDLVLSADGSFTYTPDTSYVGTDSFSYRAVDAKAQSVPTAVTITVGQVNDPPVAGNIEIATYAGKAVSRTSLPGSDVDNTSLTFLLYKAPTKGRVTITNAATGAFTYTPYSGQTGADYFVYRVFDGSLYSETPPPTLPNPIPDDRGIVSVNIVPTLASVTISANPASPRPAGLPVTLLADSTGGLNVTYQFQIGVAIRGRLSWQNLNAFGPNPFFIWTPGAPGTYKLRVLARDFYGTTVKTVTSAAISYSIVPALSKVTLSVSPPSPQPALSSITLTATPVGGMNRLYRFVLVDGSTITELREYAPANTCVWLPTTPGIYHLQVWALENGAASTTAVKSNIVDYVIISPL